MPANQLHKNLIAVTLFMVIWFQNSDAIAPQVIKQEGTVVNNYNILNNHNPQIGDSAIKAYTSTMWHSYEEFVKANGPVIGKQMSSVYNYFTDNKLKILASALIAGYTWIQYQLITISNDLMQNDRWSLWRIEKGLEHLFTIPQHQLARDLLTDIQRRYTTVNNPTDFVHPLISFMDDANKEMANLIYYKKICNILEKLHLLSFSFCNTELNKLCDERLKRLSYIKDTFLSWIAEYKLDQRAQLEKSA